MIITIIIHEKPCGALLSLRTIGSDTWGARRAGMQVLFFLLLMICKECRCWRCYVLEVLCFGHFPRLEKYLKNIASSECKARIKTTDWRYLSLFGSFLSSLSFHGNMRLSLNQLVTWRKRGGEGQQRWYTFCWVTWCLTVLFLTIKIIIGKRGMGDISLRRGQRQGNFMWHLEGHTILWYFLVWCPEYGRHNKQRYMYEWVRRKGGRPHAVRRK